MRGSDVLRDRLSSLGVTGCGWPGDRAPCSFGIDCPARLSGGRRRVLS
jgi:hypothetical protein